VGDRRAEAQPARAEQAGHLRPGGGCTTEAGISG
jgi:hypothetical protein